MKPSNALKPRTKTNYVRLKGKELPQLLRKIHIYSTGPGGFVPDGLQGVIELQLAHRERNEVSVAYNHATYLKEWRKLMQTWADHLNKLREGLRQC
ncbi:hypothetical protein PMI15_04062 [Polaromonas sp. CF318]|uniref:hypothetical protein n=1 Tax=Polaromonas sp. CF318 TaxID=1144318 RepID=UPI0002713D77|nr:hypothetical protein [Polaromonas sp. CF318]EJL79074.1 hypothetical protein PMI15_04062 [Polaromonas sp. CF318]